MCGQEVDFTVVMGEFAPHSSMIVILVCDVCYNLSKPTRGHSSLLERVVSANEAFIFSSGIFPVFSVRFRTKRVQLVHLPLPGNSCANLDTFGC